MIIEKTLLPALIKTSLFTPLAVIVFCLSIITAPAPTMQPPAKTDTLFLQHLIQPLLNPPPLFTPKPTK